MRVVDGENKNLAEVWHRGVQLSFGLRHTGLVWTPRDNEDRTMPHPREECNRGDNFVDLKAPSKNPREAKNIPFQITAPKPTMFLFQLNMSEA